MEVEIVFYMLTHLLLVTCVFVDLRAFWNPSLNLDPILKEKSLEQHILISTNTALITFVSLLLLLIMINYNYDYIIM